MFNLDCDHIRINNVLLNCTVERVDDQNEFHLITIRFLFCYMNFLGETMLSPLVMCGPQALEFLVPVTLNIPHYASKTASLGLSLKATDSEKNLQTNWDNIELPSNTAAHTVSVKVDHF